MNEKKWIFALHILWVCAGKQKEEVKGLQAFSSSCLFIEAECREGWCSHCYSNT